MGVPMPYGYPFLRGMKNHNENFFSLFCLYWIPHANWDASESAKLLHGFNFVISLDFYNNFNLSISFFRYKWHYCTFCGERSAQISRHIRKFCHKAKGTKIWAELLKLEDLNDKKNGAKTDKAYKDALTKLKNKGDHENNCKGNISLSTNIHHTITHQF